MVSDTASYKEFDATVDLLKNYVNTYIPAYKEAEALAAKAGEAGKAALESIMTEQKTKLTAEMKSKTQVESYISVLKTVMYEVNKQVMWDADQNATDICYG